MARTRARDQGSRPGRQSAVPLAPSISKARLCARDLRLSGARFGRACCLSTRAQASLPFVPAVPRTSDSAPAAASRISLAKHSLRSFGRRGLRSGSARFRSHLRLAGASRRLRQRHPSLAHARSPERVSVGRWHRSHSCRLQVRAARKPISDTLQ